MTWFISFLYNTWRNLFKWLQTWKAVEEFLYDTYIKELWIMSYGIRVKKDKNCI